MFEHNGHIRSGCGQCRRLRKLVWPYQQIEREGELCQRRVPTAPGRILQEVLARDVGPGRVGVKPCLLADAAGKRLLALTREHRV